MANKFRHPFKWRARLHHVTSPFGQRRPNGSIHRGVDLSGGFGDRIFAIGAGKVLSKGYGPSLTGGYGHWVRIDHGNGVTSLYAHMQYASPVKVGQRVQWWQYIGKVGATGGATGPHLHLEVARDGNVVDPIPFINKH